MADHRNTANIAKGQSGKPSGRPRGSRNLMTDIRSELQSLTDVTIGGSRVKMSKLRILTRALLAQGVQGNVQAAALLLNMAGRLHQDEPPAPSNSAAATPPEDAAILAAFAKRARRGGGDE